MALSTSADKPVPVRTVAQLVSQWIDRLGSIWVEGQVAQLNRRPGASLVFLTLRDTAADLSLPVTCTQRALDAAAPAISEGDRVLVFAQPTFYAPRGSFSLSAREIRHVGLGELLARLERLKSLLAAEGLFAPERKRPLPFLPRRIGVVCGRASAAQHDVVENATQRWPGVAFAIEQVAVQGAGAAAQVTT
ncbi:MAG TPA: exodeoxyribonuclease VII large subunit, partial [Actinomycetes bacterium]|nr:exodeoxyribonuclease VII large subunit [Actinomycetes bacterium]